MRSLHKLLKRLKKRFVKWLLSDLEELRIGTRTTTITPDYIRSPTIYGGPSDRVDEYKKHARFILAGGNAIFDRGVFTEYFGNFLLYADLKPGATLTTSGSVTRPENVFRPGDTYATIDTSGGACVIELTGINIPTTSSVSTNRAFIQFHGTSGTVDVKIEVQGKSGTWYTVYEGTVSIGVGKLIITDTLLSKGLAFPDEWPAKGIRVTFSNASSNPFYIRQIGVIGERNPVEAMPYLPVGGGRIYGDLIFGKEYATLRPESDGKMYIGSTDTWVGAIHAYNFIGYTLEINDIDRNTRLKIEYLSADDTVSFSTPYATTRFRFDNDIYLAGDLFCHGVLRHARLEAINKGLSDSTVTETSESLKQELSPDSGHSWLAYVEGVHIVANNPGGSGCTLYIQVRALLDDDSEVSLSDWLSVGEGSSLDDWLRWIYDAVPNGRTIKAIRLYAYCSATPASGSEPTVRIDKVVGLQV